MQIVGGAASPGFSALKIVVDLQGAQNESRFRGIGRYSLSLAHAMARHAGRHELWYALNARFPDSMADIAARLQNVVAPNRLCVFDVPAGLNQVVPQNRWRVQAAEYVRENFLAQLKPDLVHITSWFEGPLDDTVSSIDALELGTPNAVTLYDLIPLLRPESYLLEVRVRNWYLRKAQLIRRADLLLAISKSSAVEAREGLLIPDDNIVNIGAGVDHTFSPPEPSRQRDDDIRARYGLDKPFILYTGAADPRKNLSGLLHAMAALPTELRQQYLLACVGKIYDHQKAALQRLIANLGLAESDVRFLGYVPDSDLVPLYAMCELFVFPSLHEGFGLPAAEAMACGAPVIGSNTTSVPEVIGRTDALFDPSKPTDIARVMSSVLTSREFQDNLRAHGVKHARSFTWDAVAKRALAGFEMVHDRKRRQKGVVVGNSPRRQIALVTNCRGDHLSGLNGLVALLSVNFDVTLVHANALGRPRRESPDTERRSLRWLEKNRGRFDTVLYVLRDDARSGSLLATLERLPGLVWLDGFDCRKLIRAAVSCATVNAQTALYDSHGLSAVLATLNGDATTKQPCNEAVFRLSEGVLVNEPEYVGRVRRLYGDAAAERVRVVPSIPRGANPTSAAAWQDAIRELREKRSHDPETLAAIASIEFMPRADDQVEIASALAANSRRFGLPQILVDVSTIAATDARTGIQRVVRSIFSELLAIAPPGWRIEPVRVQGEGYVYARAFAARAFNLPALALPPDAPVETARGDIYLGLDLIAHLLAPQRPWFQAQRRRGVFLAFVIYDLLPLRRPEIFPAGVPPMFQKWSRVVAEIADSVICISRAVASEFSQWLDTEALHRSDPMHVGWFHLGADLEASLPTKGIPPESETILATMKSRPTFLSVGTLEPRKRHAQALDAFDRLWSRGIDVGLAIVGQQGWRTEDLAARLMQHPEQGKRLFWLKGISDEMLTRVYEACSCLLTASEGEGFGLPLVEAAHHRLPVLARDLPVFREIAGDSAWYFNGDDSQSLATAVEQWLALFATGEHPRPDGISCLTWRESATQLLSALGIGALSQTENGDATIRAGSGSAGHHPRAFAAFTDAGS